MAKTLSAGTKAGFSSAMGAVTMDLFYGTMVFFFLGNIKHLLIKYAIYSEILVSLIFIKVGYDKIKTTVLKDNNQINEENILFRDYISTVVMSLTNVPNVLSLIGLFAALQLYEHVESKNVIGLWWGFILSEIPLWWAATYLLNKFRERVSSATLTKIVRSAGFVLLMFGIIIGIRGIYEQIQRLI
jgi:threonine/homoserine/homoserine lactone efflux protein